MSNDKNTADNGQGINRRTVLKSAAVASAAGLVGLPAFSGNAIGQSPTETLYLTDSGLDANDDGGSKLFEVDLDDANNVADLTLLKELDDGFSDLYDQVDALAATPDGDEIYAIDKLSKHMGLYDVDGGGFTDIGAISGLPTNAVQAAFSPQGVLYISSNETDDLHEISDLTNPAISSGDTVDLDDDFGMSGADIVFAADGTLYIYTNDGDSNGPGLYKIDDLTATQPISPDFLGKTEDRAFTGLAIRDAGAGALVGSTHADESTNTSRIYTIDPSDGSQTGAFDTKANGSDYLVGYGDMTVGILDTCTTTLDLCADQDTFVGTVTVTDDGDALSITFEMDPNEGWLLYETHVDIGDEYDDFHTNRGGNPKVGQFDLSETHDGVTEYTYTVDCDDEALADVMKNAETLYIAVHAVVANPGMETSSNLVTNGGFEEPEIGHENHWNVFGASTTPTLPGWTVEWSGTTTSFGGLTRPNPQLEIQEEGIRSGWTASEGDQWAELDSDWDGPDGSVSGEPSNVRISQDIGTPETFYKLSYSYSPRPSVEKNFLDVYWDGMKIASHTADGSSNSTTDWTDEEIVVQTSDSDTVLAFAEKLEQSAEADSLGMFLDNVELVEIREETAWVCEGETVSEFEGSNWARYFVYETCAPFENCEEESSNGGGQPS